MRTASTLAALALGLFVTSAARAEPVFCNLLISGPEGTTPQITGSFTEIDVELSDGRYVVDGEPVEDFFVTVAVSLGIEEVTDTQGNSQGFILLYADTAMTCRVVTKRE